jgi:hypothetical protein
VFAKAKNGVWSRDHRVRENCCSTFMVQAGRVQLLAYWDYPRYKGKPAVEGGLSR